MKTRLHDPSRRAAVRRLGAGVLAVLTAAGCTSAEALRRDLRETRAAGFANWSTRHAGELDRLPALTGRLGLEDAVKIALLHNQDLQATLLEKDVSRGRVIESYGEVLPKVNASGAYTRVDEVRSIKVADRTVNMGFLNSYAADLQVRQPLYRGGAMSSALRAARLYEQLADETVRAKIQTTVFDTASSYYDALLARHLFEVNRDAVASAEAHLRDVEVKRRNGVASRYDVLRAEVDVSNFRAEMIQQQNRLHLAKMRLQRAMGVSPGSEIELSGELRHEAATADLEDALRRAHANRPDLFLSELNVRLQEEAVTVARSEYWPELDAVYNLGWARPDPHQSMLDEWGEEWSAGILLTWPIFDGLRREGRLRREQATLRRREVERNDAEDRAYTEIRQALFTLQDTAELVESQRLNLARAAEGLRLAEVGYREGVNTLVEVTDARAALTRARGLHYQAIHDHTLARLGLQRAMGELGPKAGESTRPEEVAARPPPSANAVPAVPTPVDGTGVRP